MNEQTTANSTSTTEPITNIPPSSAAPTVSEPESTATKKAKKAAEPSAEQKPNSKAATDSAPAQGRAAALTEDELYSLMDARIAEMIEERVKAAMAASADSDTHRERAKDGDAEGRDASGATETADISEQDDAKTEVTPAEAEREAIARTLAARKADLTARRRTSAWLREAAVAKENYPGFDLARELRGKSGARFRALLQSGVDMSTAYEVVHSRELIPAAIRAAAREIEDGLVRGVISGSHRPAENALGGGGSLPAMLGIGVSHMSRADRDDIARRVARGEIIKL